MQHPDENIHCIDWVDCQGNCMHVLVASVIISESLADKYRTKTASKQTVNQIDYQINTINNFQRYGFKNGNK